jgi:hypothetical protein
MASPQRADFGGPRPLSSGGLARLEKEGAYVRASEMMWAGKVGCGRGARCWCKNAVAGV